MGACQSLVIHLKDYCPNKNYRNVLISPQWLDMIAITITCSITNTKIICDVLWHTD